jgi:cytochrome c biogenesis protein CcmG/thiol:disulfide interchange protein DsbE
MVIRDLARGLAAASVWRYLLVVLLAGPFLVGCGEEAPQLRNGEPAPEFAMPRLEGPPLTFPADLRGEVVAVRFWADWCPFCESEMRDIEPLYRAYRDRGLRVLAVNVRQDRETAARFIEQLGVSYEVLLDGDGSVARRFGVIGLPTTFFIDREGRLATRILGESTPEVFAQVVEGLL